MALLWDDRIEDFNEFLDVCAHHGCDEIVESMHYRDPASGRLVQYGGRARVLLVPRIADVGEAASAREGQVGLVVP